VPARLLVDSVSVDRMMQLQPTQANEPTIPSFYQPTHYQPTNEQALNMQQAAPSFYQPQANH
jgi:hypothetical protein